MWDPNAWTAGMSKEPRKPNLKPYFSDTAAKDRVPDVAKRKVGFEPFQISKIDRDQDSKKEKPKAISRVHTVPNDNHINDLSYAISQMLGHDKVERTKTMGYAVGMCCTIFSGSGWEHLDGVWVFITFIFVSRYAC